MADKPECARLAKLSLLVCSIALLLATPLLAQLPTGTILGIVSDSSGAVIAGAMVTVNNVETGAARTLTTETDGSYRFNALPVGNYSIQASASGFETQTRRGVVLAVAQEAVINVTLSVGTQAQTVEVTAEVPQVDTTDASLGGVVTQEKIQNLPLNGRNYLDLMLFQPGVTRVVPQTAIPTINGTEFVSNGATPRSNNFMLDGAILTNAGGANSGSVTGTSLGLDGIKEFKVITNLFSAEYPLSMGSQTVMVSRGGTNQFHGDAFEYVRNSALDASNFFDVNGKSALSRNQFGGSIGGPIQKNKTFFYGTYEGVLQTQGITDISQFDIPEAGCRGPANAVIWNGQGVQPSGSLGPCPQLGSDPQGNGSNFVTMNPFTAELLALVPLPNFEVGQGVDPVSGQTNGDIFTYPHNQTTREHYGQIRVDHTFSASDSFFGRYTVDDALQNTPGSFPGLLVTLQGRSQFVTLAEDHIFSPSVINALRLSFSRPTLTSTSTGSNGQNGLPDYRNSSLAVPMVSSASGLVGQYIGEFGSAHEWSVGTNYPFTTQSQNIYTVSDDVFWNRGKHAFKFGVLFNRYNQPLDLTLFTNGVIGTNLATPTSSSNAAFDRGLITEMQVTPPATNLNKDYLYNTYGFYAEDDIRITRRFTANLGLRYEFRGPIGMLDFKTKSFAFLNFPNVLNGTGALNGPVDAGSCVGTLIPNCIVPSSGNSSGTTQTNITRNPTLHNFSPRVGFAWDVFGDGKTAVRGGAGIFYDLANFGSALTNDSYGTPPIGYQSIFYGSLAHLCLPLDTCFPVPTPQNSTWPYPYAGEALSTIQYNSGQPTMYQWNLSIQRQLPGHMTLTVSYVGGHSIHLWDVQEGNPAVPDQTLDSQNPLCSTAAAPPNCTPAGVLPASNTPGGLTWFNSNCPFPPATPALFLNPNDVTAGSPTINVNACRLNPYYGDYTLYATAAASWYDALQVEVRKVLGHGFEFQGSYTYGKLLDTAESQTPGDSPSSDISNPFNPMFDKGPSQYDMRHQLTVNALYYFPGPKSQSFLGKVGSGWWTSNIVTVNSGPYWTPTVPGGAYANDQNTAGVNEFPSYVTAANLAAARAIDPLAEVYNPNTVIVGGLNEWFNPHMFTTPTFGTLGTVSRGILRAPGLFDWDFSLAKDTSLKFLGEAGKLQFRADFFNILNHPSFAPPLLQVFSYAPSPTPSAGLINSTNGIDQREIQLSVRIEF